MCVKEDGIKRRRWKIGRVTEIIRGRDGVVREAKLQEVSEKNKKRQAISRPLQLSYPLEVKTEDDSRDAVDGKDKESDNDEMMTRKDDDPRQATDDDKPSEGDLDGGKRRKWPKRIAEVDGQVRRRIIQSINDGADQMD